MSLLNVWVEPGRALVAVDTETDIAGEHMDASKLVVFPADRMVVACRGNLGVLNGMLPVLHGMPGGVDSIAPVLAAVCSDMAGRIDGHSVQAGGPGFTEAEVVIAGWSEREQRIVGHVCTRLAGEAAFALSRIDSWRIGPNADWQRVLPPDCREHMEAIASKQVRFMREQHPDCAIGGRLLMAEVTEREISVRELLRFPEPA